VHVLRHPSAFFGKLAASVWYMPHSTPAMLIFSFIMSKLDYRNVALAGFRPRCDLDRLSGLSSTLPHASQSVRSGMTTSPRSFTGCGCPSAYSRLQFVCSGTTMCSDLPEKCHLSGRVVCARRLQRISSCRRHVAQHGPIDRAFAVAGPRAWNSLPDAIRHNPSPASSSVKLTSSHKAFIDCFYSRFCYCLRDCVFVTLYLYSALEVTCCYSTTFK